MNDSISAGTLTVTATISNTAPRIGDVLNGTLVSSNNTDTLTYVWKAGGMQVGTDSSYTVAVEDLSKTITLEIQSSIETGTRSGRKKLFDALLTIFGSMNALEIRLRFIEGF